jgi:hypothetical protein
VRLAPSVRRVAEAALVDAHCQRLGLQLVAAEPYVDAARLNLPSFISRNIMHDKLRWSA